MKYGDLVSFEPVSTIKVLTEANNVDRAREDVRTFVISDQMAAVLCDIVFPQLQFTTPAENKGMLVVGTYGTGKTHLMSVISAVAEHGELAGDLTNARVAEAASRTIAGQFQVVRDEIGSTTMGLRDVVCRILENGLSRLGVSYAFPDQSQVTNTKDSLVEMMAAFDAKYAGQGLMLVLDELLDFLRGRRDAELIQDLRFLREIGEITRSTRFRFVAGIQEGIFDNPRFANVGDAVGRVRDRFEQVRITREDIAFVVRERLLRKTVGQRDAIRRHLLKFTPGFEGMAENLETFVSLFPVHPEFLKTFERLQIVEKRRVLATVSDEMKRRMDLEVPDDEPGTFSYDMYRSYLAADRSYRMLPEVREVLDKSDVLRGRVERSVPASDRPMALRLIDGLAVLRLTTDDIYVPIGATAAELRDDLCLMPSNTPEIDVIFLEESVESVVDEIMKAVSGQFITRNPENSQIYLDLKKDIDYERRIEERADSLDDAALDAAYFTALERVLELRDQPYVQGYRIWRYPVLWPAKNVWRIGYLFMGAPNERSTAQPPRDFYLYFLQPYESPVFDDAERADELFFGLTRPAQEFTSALQKYAAALALSHESTETHRAVYEDKANSALGDMILWLRTHMADAITVTYQGEAKPLRAWLATALGPRQTVKEQVDTIASSVLTAHFDSRYPGYPVFGIEVTPDNLEGTVRQALSQIATDRATSFGSKALAALDLLGPKGELIATGPFAQHVLSQLASAGGRVVNRGDLLTERDRGLFTWGPWHLEPAWLVVTAVALCQLGDLEVGFPPPVGQVDATMLDRVTRLSLDELDAISHIAPPKATPVAQLRNVAKLLGLTAGDIPNQGATPEVVTTLLTAAADLVRRLTSAKGHLIEGVEVWGAPVLDERDERLRRLEAFERVVNDVVNRRSPGAMNRLSVSPTALAEANAGKDELTRVEDLVRITEYLAAPVNYLREASRVFGAANPFASETETLRNDVLDLFRPEMIDVARGADLKVEADKLRRRYADEAVRAHRRDRLDADGEQAKRRLLDGQLFRDLDTLAGITLLPDDVLSSLRASLADVGTCMDFDETNLYTRAICPDCSYEPRPRAGGTTARERLDEIATQATSLLGEWEAALRDSLRAPELAEQVTLLKQPGRGEIEAFIASGRIASPVTSTFVAAANQVLDRFVVRRVSASEVWHGIFPAQAPATLGELRSRFSDFLDELRGGEDEDKVRVVPSDEAKP